MSLPQKKTAGCHRNAGIYGPLIGRFRVRVNLTEPVKTFLEQVFFYLNQLVKLFLGVSFFDTLPEAL
jgi:hypothetical protein